MKSKRTRAYYCPIIIGIILIFSDLIIHIPGGALTTYESLDGVSTENYVFDDEYSSIDEYVGGDAYNYIIGASLVAGKIAGMIAAKAICIVGGAMCLCFGITLKRLYKERVLNKKRFKDDEINHSDIAYELANGETPIVVSEKSDETVKN